MSRDALKPYNWLARYYDTVFTFQHSWAQSARRKVLGQLLPDVTAACDLACGTGTTAVSLARSGIRMFGIDVSPHMCRAARRKAREARLPVRILQADMRDFRLPETVDLVLCEFDALNHVPRKSDLIKVARSVARALRPGGHFYFDVNNRLGFASYWKGCFWVDKKEVLLLMRNDNDAEHDRAWTDCEWFIRKGRLWRRHRERVEEVCWSRTEILSTLRIAGFTTIQAWDSAPLMKTAKVITRGCRTHYLARKRSK